MRTWPSTARGEPIGPAKFTFAGGAAVVARGAWLTIGLTERSCAFSRASMERGDPAAPAKLARAGAVEAETVAGRAVGRGAEGGVAAAAGVKPRTLPSVIDGAGALRRDAAVRVGVKVPRRSARLAAGGADVTLAPFPGWSPAGRDAARATPVGAATGTLRGAEVGRGAIAKDVCGVSRSARLRICAAVSEERGVGRADGRAMVEADTLGAGTRPPFTP